MVDIKIDDLPPNVLLMRILGGMKSTATPGIDAILVPLQMHRQPTSTTSTTVPAVGNLKLSNLNLNGISSEHGAGGVNAYIRDQVKRAANAAAQHAEQQRPTIGGPTVATAMATEASTATTNNAINTTAKPSTTTEDNTQNALRSIQQQAGRQPLQALPSTVNSNNSQQQQQQQQQSNNTTSPASIPHAKALYDFESKEPG